MSGITGLLIRFFVPDVPAPLIDSFTAFYIFAADIKVPIVVLIALQRDRLVFAFRDAAGA